ncbi:MAG: hypothetical protein AB8F74_14415 [Saprospiraceae bacterium]
MPSLWDQIKQLFKTVEESSPSRPVVKSTIKRSEEELADYEKWKPGLSAKRLVDWIHNEYATHLIDPEQVDESIDFINVRATYGFAIHFYKMNYPLRDITHLFDLLKEKMRTTAGYRSYTSNSRTYNRPKWVERLDRHYLKPPIIFLEDGVRIDQKFGNVTIELLFRNDEPYQLKFSATSYVDRNYKKAEGFGDLMEVLRT